MRVLHINDHLAYKGGVEVYALSLIRSLRGRGLEVGFAFGSGDSEAHSPSFHVPSISSVSWGRHRQGRTEMDAVLQSYRPDVCHVHGVFNSGTLESCLDYGPTILHLHDYRYLCPSSGLYYRRGGICSRGCSALCFPIGFVRGCQTIRMPAGWAFYSRVQYIRRNASRFTRILANSHYVASRFVQSIGPQEHLEVLHYFSPVEVGTSPPSATSSPSVLFVGRVREAKGILPFIDVVSRLPKNVRGTIVGDPDDAMRRLIRDEADQRGCLNRIEMSGWRDRKGVADLVQAATAVIFPSLWAEPFGIVGIEAMARGVPVVGFNVGGVRDWLEDEKTGYLVGRNDTAAMSNRVKVLLDDSELRKRMGLAGMEKVRREFGREKHLERLLALYRERGE